MLIGIIGLDDTIRCGGVELFTGFLVTKVEVVSTYSLTLSYKLPAR